MANPDLVPAPGGPVPRVGIVVVAYNAASTLAATLDRIPPEVLPQLAEVIISDDASHDDTFDQARRWGARASDVKTTVVRHTKNLGYGGNQKAAYRLAIDHGLDIVVLLHGDGQYAPEFLPQLLAPFRESDVAAVFGSRMMERGAARAGGMPFYKRVGNRILSTFENRMLGTRLSEFHSGYRAYSTRTLSAIPFEANSDGFDFDTQIIAQIVQAGGTDRRGPDPDVLRRRDLLRQRHGVRARRRPGRGRVQAGHQGLRHPGVGRDAGGVPVQGGRRVLAHGDAGDAGRAAAVPDPRPGLLRRPVRRTGPGRGPPRHRRRRHGDPRRAGAHRRFLVADLEQGIPAEIEGPFDIVVAGDVIEHLARPVHLLRDIRRVLRPGGELLLSVPNFGHWYPRVRVATGLFGYDRRGILDDTHLRFFTRATLRRTVRAAGFDVLQESATGLPLGVIGSGASSVPLNAVRRLDAALVRARPTLFGYQHILRLVPHAEDAIFALDLEPGAPRATPYSSTDGDLAVDRAGSPSDGEHRRAGGAPGHGRPQSVVLATPTGQRDAGAADAAVAPRHLVQVLLVVVLGVVELARRPRPTAARW